MGAVLVIERQHMNITQDVHRKEFLVSLPTKIEGTRYGADISKTQLFSVKGQLVKYLQVQLLGDETFFRKKIESC